MFNETQLAAALQCPIARAVRWHPLLLRSMNRNGITTKLRAALFLAQLGHESLSLARLEENLNYSAARLLEIFGDYFSREESVDFARKPERIANRVYANRNGNGNEASGDGYRYRGRAPIQLTGRSNYAWMQQLIDQPLIDMPDLALDLPIAAEISAAWWRGSGLNAIADSGDVLSVSRRINLGTTRTKRVPHGLADRMDRTKRAKEALGVSP